MELHSPSCGCGRLATAFTAWFPSLGGLLVLTMLSSIGFHYYETVNQSLQLQWLPKDRAPQMLGWLMGAGSAVTLAVFVLIVMMWQTLALRDLPALDLDPPHPYAHADRFRRR